MSFGPQTIMRAIRGRNRGPAGRLVDWRVAGQVSSTAFADLDASSDIFADLFNRVYHRSADSWIP